MCRNHRRRVPVATTCPSTTSNSLKGVVVKFSCLLSCKLHDFSGRYINAIALGNLGYFRMIGSTLYFCKCLRVCLDEVLKCFD